MTTTVAQQVALYNALVPLKKRVKIDVLKIYMHRFWFTINKHGSSYQFKIGKKRFSFDIKVFREILLLCPRLLDQGFDEPPSEEEFISFIKELGHIGIKNITAMVVDHMHQLWRTFAITETPRNKTKCTIPDSQRLSFITSFPKISLSMRIRMFMHTAQDDCILGLSCLPDLSCICYWSHNSKDEKDIQETCFSFIEKTLVTVEEEVHELAKKVKAPSTTVKSKRINLLSKATLLEEAQLKKVLKKSKSVDTHERTGSKPRVHNVSKVDSSKSEYESWGDSGDEANEKSDDDHEQVDDELTESDNPRTSDEEEETQDDEYVHTPEDYVPTNDETNVESNGDAEMTHAEQVNVEHEEVSQEVTGDQVKDEAQTTVMAALAIEVPTPSSSISSDYAAKYLNFDNIPLADTKVVSIMDINVQHEVPQLILEDEDAIDKGVADKLKKRKLDDADKDEGLSSSKSGKSTKDQVVELISMQDSNNAEHDDADYADMPMDQGEDLGNTNEQPNNKDVHKNDCDIAKATKPPLTFDELMHTPINFSTFVMNRLQINNLTKEFLVRPAYNLLKGTCKSYVELDYTMEECYHTLSKKLDWSNLKGHRCPYDLTKPLLVQMSSQGHQIVPANFFFNNNLEYLRRGSNDKKYTASMTNSKTARYELKGIEDMVMDDPNITIEEYIMLEEEKACRCGKVYNRETATYGKIWCDEDVYDLRSVETEFPAIVYNDTLTSEVTLSCESTVSPLNKNQIDFRILFDESVDEDYMIL
nr:hypothetical protein [Tanacetum cinerariifolium]